MLQKLKCKLISWLGIDDKVNINNLSHVLRRCEFIEILDRRVAELFDKLFKPNYDHDDKTIKAFKDIIHRQTWDILANHENTGKKIIDEYIKSEEFIDRIISRINSKQLK